MSEIGTQMNIFECGSDEPLKIRKKIRLIELFAGYGSQSLALHYINADYESHRICEWNYKSFHAYRLLHSIDVGVDYSLGHSDDEILSRLLKSGISADWNKPMTEQQIRRLSPCKRREIYSDIIATHNLVDVSKVHAGGLGMTDRDKYCYVMTYSFPCQDLSIAGKCLGMKEGSGTRSGLLWEVERILRECGDSRPDILLMENVTQVHSKRNAEDWNRWLSALEEMGYTNNWKDMIATDYGIPQTRNRCFMVSTGYGSFYTFPKPQKLVYVEKDFLEENPLSKYILSDHAVKFWKEHERKMIERGNGFRFKVTNGEGNARTILTAPGSRIDDNYVYVEPKLKDFLDLNVSEKYYLTEKQVEHIRAWNGSVKEGTVIGGMQEHQSVRNNGSCTTLNTCTGGNRMPKIAIKAKTEKGYQEASEGDSIGITFAGSAHTPVSHGVSRTLSTLGTIVTNGSSPNHNWRVGYGLRIRKLTPRECFRLMGVRDGDFDRIRDEFADATLYHLAGDSIVVNVLMAIFGEML